MKVKLNDTYIQFAENQLKNPIEKSTSNWK